MDEEEDFPRYYLSEAGERPVRWEKMMLPEVMNAVGEWLPYSVDDLLFRSERVSEEEFKVAVARWTAMK